MYGTEVNLLQKILFKAKKVKVRTDLWISMDRIRAILILLKECTKFQKPKDIIDMKSAN